MTGQGQFMRHISAVYKIAGIQLRWKKFESFQKKQMTIKCIKQGKTQPMAAEVMFPELLVISMSPLSK